MPDTALPTSPVDTLLAEMMIDAVEKVFGTMVRRKVVLTRQFISDRGHAAAPDLEGGDFPVVVGTVGFIGKTNGVIYLYLPEPLAIGLACDMLGLESTDLGAGDAETVNDAIGELTNMVVGTFKNQLCDRGLDCHLTIPSILRGSRFRVQPVANATRRVFEFETGGSRFLSDVLIEPTP
jgi:chemotaxis protein CheX